MNDTQNIDDGGPAFPTQGYDSPNHGWIYGSDGMALRDLFAVAALQGMRGVSGLPAHILAECAADAYKVADAMIAARKGKL